MEKINLSKEQWCALLNLDQPELYKDYKDALKWWRFGILYRNKFKKQ